MFIAGTHRSTTTYNYNLAHNLQTRSKEETISKNALHRTN